MVTPTKSQIHAKAEELFFESRPEALTTPEIEELKEGGYWQRARDALMRGERAEIEAGEAMEIAGVKEALEKASIMETIRKIEADIGELKTKVKEAPVKILSKRKIVRKRKMLRKRLVRRKVKRRMEKTIHCSICGASIKGSSFPARMEKLRRHRKRKHPKAHRKSIRKALRTKRKRGIIKRRK